MKRIKVQSIPHLKELTKDRAEEFVMILEKGLRSNKRIEWIEEENKFWIYHYIDSTEEMLSESELGNKGRSNVVFAIEMGTFYMEIEEEVK